MLKVNTSKAPRPNGHYSQAIVHRGTLYMSLQLPLDPVTLELAGSLEEQCDQLFANSREILLAGGSSYDMVVSATIYVADMDDWLAVNNVFAAHLGEHRPARAVVCVKQLHMGTRIGLQLIANVED